ncbi:site-2 protease family protein [Irregularibacter muris]|uniref:Site-2 protease family protein n=1 Tax=Irregularibacter muris TaxID=1796619 RepID=A0AAE3HG98_9FIRM|nr:site-2 protease family protein [Irregularibacter muris]MCR1898043.1 site-2 protease family protein [Irregularibacter muris]
MFNYNLMDLLYTLPPLIIALTFHEFSHAFVAYKLGDITAKSQGRLTINPIKHIDPIGFFMFVFFKFGWAKPVPYNPMYFKDRKRGTFLVALAGPMSNLLLAFLSIICMFIIQPRSVIGHNLLQSFFIYNLILAVFNLIPIPPLDGSKIFASILPNKIERYFWEYERYGYPILLILIATNLLDKILSPAIALVGGGLINIVTVLFKGV